MLENGLYKYFKINDDGSRAHEGSIRIADQKVFIVADLHGAMHHMFKEGPLTRHTEDIMRSVNRNGYAVFIKSPSKQVAPTPKKPNEQSENTNVKSIYTELGKNENDIAKGDFSNKVRAGIAAGAVLMGMGGNVDAAKPIKQETPIQYIAQKKQAPAIPKVKSQKEKQRILNSIVDVESSGNKDRAHAKLPSGGIHHGERAYGAYGLTPIIIRETLKANPKIFEQHQDAIKLRGSDLHNYMDKNPELEHQIASTHYDRLSKVFGNDPSKIGYAWLNGITGTKKALKANQEIKSHWHVKKILDAYERQKKQTPK